MAPQSPAHGLDEHRFTVEKLYQYYPEEALKATVDINYFDKSRNKTIRDLEDQIQKGVNPEACEKALNEFIASTPKHPPIDPSEPPRLCRRVTWRIGYLKHIKSLNISSPEDKKNIDAILEAYRSEKLNGKIDLCTVWYAGTFVIGPVPRKGFNEHGFIDHVKEWNNIYGFGQVFIEEIDEDLPFMNLYSTTVRGQNEFGMHFFQMQIRLIGESSFTVLPLVIDDTGSSYLEVFEKDDCSKLRLTPAYSYMRSPIQLQTANGLVPRKLFELEAQLLRNKMPFGPVRVTLAVISPGFGSQKPRCSGPFMRQHLFTGTNLNGLLCVSNKKTGVVRTLPP